MLKNLAKRTRKPVTHSCLRMTELRQTKIKSVIAADSGAFSAQKNNLLQNLVLINTCLFMLSTGKPLPEKEKKRAGRDREKIVRPQTQQAFRC